MLSDPSPTKYLIITGQPNICRHILVLSKKSRSCLLFQNKITRYVNYVSNQQLKEYSTLQFSNTPISEIESHVVSFRRLTDRHMYIIIHYSDVMMGGMASQITSLTIVYPAVYSVTDQRKHQSSASLAFVQGIHWSPVNSQHKGSVTRKMSPFDDVIMNPAALLRMCNTFVC